MDQNQVQNEALRRAQEIILVNSNTKLDLSKLTVIIGSNLSSKSAILRCIYSSVPAPEKFNLGSYTGSLEEYQVEGEENFDYVMYIDVYAITYRIYEELRDLMERYAERKNINEIVRKNNRGRAGIRFQAIRHLSACPHHRL